MNKDNTKKIAKAMGVKSVFTDGEKVTITSFGKGNDATIENIIENNVIKDASGKATFTFGEISDSVYPLKKGRISAPADNNIDLFRPKAPSVSQSGVSIPGYRKAVEKYYFGKSFTDNFHIQLAHNIMDIEKILAVYINNIVYSIDQCYRQTTGNENYDFLGFTFFTNENTKGYFEYVDNYEAARKKVKPGVYDNNTKAVHSYEHFRKFVLTSDGKSINPRLAYWGDALIDCNKAKKSGTEEAVKIVYGKLALLSYARQSVSHSNSGRLFNLSSFGNYHSKKAIEIQYKNKIYQLNKSFIKNSQKNLYIIFELLNVRNNYPEKKRLLNEYYDFIVRKENKNMGFSLKHLRELVLGIFNGKAENEGLDNKRFDPHRSKLYRIIDFIIYDYYKNGEGKTAAEEIPKKLRTCLDDDEKEAVYKNAANRLYDRLSELLKKLMLNSKVYLEQKNCDTGLKAQDSENLISARECSENWYYFCEFIYFLTLFIDGKEINELVTGLIHKFENIASVIEVMKSSGTEVGFGSNFRMFADSAETSAELRTMLSFARMEKASEDAKKVMYEDALTILGVKDRENEIKTLLEKSEKGNNHRRNFIANNVIESNRFKYLMRYSSADELAKIKLNEPLLRFVIGRMDEKHITRYYNLLPCPKPENKIDALAEFVSKMSYSGIMEKIADSKNKIIKSEEENRKKLLSFYFTVLYHLVKNLVNVNSRYYMAFYSLERDKFILYGHKTDDAVLTESTIRYLESGVNTPDGIFTDSEKRKNYSIELQNKYGDDKPGYHREMRKLKKEYECWRWMNNLKCNKNLLTDDIRVKHRNIIAHLTIIRSLSHYLPDRNGSGYGEIRINSYFGLYHHCVQEYFARGGFNNNINPEDLQTVKERLEKAVKSGEIFSRDLVWALNVPFCYNMPRYKNLSVENLFDMNERTGDIEK